MRAFGFLGLANSGSFVHRQVACLCDVSSGRYGLGGITLAQACERLGEAKKMIAAGKFCSLLCFVEQPLSKSLYWLSTQFDGLREDEAEGFRDGFSVRPRGDQAS